MMNADLLIENGLLVTMNDSLEVIENGSVGIRENQIIAVGPTEEIRSEINCKRTIDASDQIVLPGLINTHVHVSDVLSRGLGKQRLLHDWMVNSKQPFVAAMDKEDHEIASKLYSYESISSGITTFVENAGATGKGYDEDVIETKMDVYDNSGIRNVYAHGFITQRPNEETASMLETFKRKEPEVNHPPAEIVTAQEGLEKVESLIEAYHGTASGRQSVWPAPYIARSVSDEALRGAYELAEKHDVMTTTHTAESEFQERYPISSVEFLDSAGYLGKRCLLGHCVQTDHQDLQLLAENDVKVAHNIAANLALASGVAPIPDMIDMGITIGIGTDNACLSDVVNLFSDMRMISLVHKGHFRNPRAVTAKQTLAMATKGGAEAIGKRDSLGSIETGKKADILLLDLDHPHLVPTTNVYSTIVHQMQGHELETVICNGDVIMNDGKVDSIEQPFSELRSDATSTTERVIDRAGLRELGS
jgi:cytosine/adenosine deaminase-related metal-dependent hydrolase